MKLWTIFSKNWVFVKILNPFRTQKKQNIVSLCFISGLYFGMAEHRLMRPETVFRFENRERKKVFFIRLLKRKVFQQAKEKLWNFFITRWSRKKAQILTGRRIIVSLWSICVDCKEIKKLDYVFQPPTEPFKFRIWFGQIAKYGFLLCFVLEET